jgi:hypothetical protein
VVANTELGRTGYAPCVDCGRGPASVRAICWVSDSMGALKISVRLQIPRSRIRAHFVKAKVRVHQYCNGTNAIFHGPRCLARYRVLSNRYAMYLKGPQNVAQLMNGPKGRQHRPASAVLSDRERAELSRRRRSNTPKRLKFGWLTQ